MKRFWSKVDKNGPIPAHLPALGACWVWTAHTSRGYGTFRLHGKKVRAHRVSWESVNGEVPDGQCVLHKCDNPPCVRPDHLFLGTQLENIADRDAKGRTVANGRVAELMAQHPELVPRGSARPEAKTTESDVLDMRAIYAFGATQDAIAKAYGLSQSTVSSLLNRRTWSHVP